MRDEYISGMTKAVAAAAAAAARLAQLNGPKCARIYFLNIWLVEWKRQPYTTEFSWPAEDEDDAASVEVAYAPFV